MSMKTLARIAGFLYLSLAFLGPIGLMVVPAEIIVEDDPNATAQNIIESEGLFRVGLLAETSIFVIEVVLVALLYILFKRVNEMLSLMAAFARLSMAIIQSVNVLIGLAVLLLLRDADYLASFEPSQLNGIALFLLHLRESGILVWEIFFALHLLILGYLLARSGYVPRILGWMIMIASGGYAVHGLGTIMFPDAETSFETVTVVLAVIPEIALTLWLLIRGVDTQGVTYDAPTIEAE